MSGLRWTLARLAAMPPGELLHRGRTVLRDRLAPPAWTGWTPEQACARLLGGDAARALRESPLRSAARLDALRAENLPGTRAAARELRAGRWRVFGHAVQLDDPPRWERDPVSGVEWPDLPSARVDWRRGDPKPVWELGRLTLLPTLALAARLDGDPAAAGLAARWLDDWTTRHASARGIHFAGGIELAVRVLTVSWTLMLLHDATPRPRLEPALGLLARQALHIRDHLSLGSSANNHLIAEYAALAVMGSSFPAMTGAVDLARTGLDGLEREALRQIHPDGVPGEQAFGYLPFVWELLLAGLLAGEAAGRPASAAVRERLAASLEFARAIRLPGGGWPRVGDEDDGRILLAEEAASRLDLVGNALAAWLDADGLAKDGEGLARLLVGREPRAAREAADGRHDFASGGYTVWRERGLHVTFDHGPLGLGPLAAHGHADALSLAIQHGADPIVVDPGTFAYHEDPAARDRCRSTPLHGTVHFGGRSQSEMRGPFLWGARATVHAEGDAWACEWHDGARHLRTVSVAPGRITIDDRVQGRDPELSFTLAPAARATIEGTCATVEIGATRAVFTGAAAWRLVPAEAAAGFARREPAQRLAASIAPACRTEITLAAR